MSICIVKCFKMVYVKHTDGKRNLQTGGLIPFYGTALIVLPPVRDPGQLISPGLLLPLPAVII